MVKVKVTLECHFIKTQCFLRSFVLTGKVCQAKTSYFETEIEWGASSEPCMTLEKGAFRLSRPETVLQHIYPVPLPQDALLYQSTEFAIASRTAASGISQRDCELEIGGTIKKTTSWNHPKHVLSLYTTFSSCYGVRY